MKIKGTPLVTDRAVDQVSILRGKAVLTFTIRALPLGFEETVLQRLPSPRAPRKFAMKDGKVLRDERGVPVQEPETDNPVYRKALTHVSFLQMIAMAHEALRGDPEVSWDTQEPTKDSGWDTFYEGILGEMKASNLTTGDIKNIVEKTLALSSIKDEDIEAARERFFPEGQGGEEGLVP